jgi:hypothetical protein
MRMPGSTGSIAHALSWHALATMLDGLTSTFCFRIFLSLRVL